MRFIMRFMTGVLTAALLAAATVGAGAGEVGGLRQLVDESVQPLLPADGKSGVAVVVRSGGHTSFFNYGRADASGRPITSDLLFNLGSVTKVFDTTLLADALGRGELRFDTLISDDVTELRQGGDMRRVTYGQLATYTSGLVLAQDHPPWPQERFTLPEFIRTLQSWKADAAHQPGKQSIYSHAGFVLLHLALERRFGKPIWDLMDERVLRPLGLKATLVPRPGANPRGELDPARKRRAVQGYSEEGEATGEPGDTQGYYLWAGTGQMFSSPNEMAVFLAANLGEGADGKELHDAMAIAHKGVFALNRCITQALAWEVRHEKPEIVDKYGGLNNATSYIGLMPSERIGVVLLANRGSQGLATAGRQIVRAIARRKGVETESCSTGE